MPHYLEEQAPHSLYPFGSSQVHSSSLQFTIIHSDALQSTPVNSNPLQFTIVHFGSLHLSSALVSPIHFTSFHFTSLHFSLFQFSSIRLRSIPCMQPPIHYLFRVAKIYDDHRRFPDPRISSNLTVRVLVNSLLTPRLPAFRHIQTSCQKPSSCCYTRNAKNVAKTDKRS